MKRRTRISLLLTLPLAAFMSADEVAQQVSPDGYAHGFTSCLQGIDGPGNLLHLSPNRGCNSYKTYPYLEIYIREQPVPTNRRILIGDTNWAFRCISAKKACEQFSSGELMLSHFESVDKDGIHTDGWYELKFPSGPPETGRFDSVCVAPCA